MWILLNDTTELVAFRNGARFFDGTIEVQQGRYIIDAKSTLGLFSLDLSKPVDVTITCDSDRVKDNFYDYVKKWRVENGV